MFSGFEEHGQGVTAQGSPNPHPSRASTLGVLVDAPVPVSAPPTPTPAPATQFAADPTVPALTFVSSHGETARQPRDDTNRGPPTDSSTGAPSTSIAKRRSVINCS
ncbi:hypothetical protein H4582DRAFT_2063535 [Lactarius indigo]|nr:hypothetical protein H4582DRAFT_2063535 [Lactarius indigo]